MPSLRYHVILFDVGDTLVGARESFGATYARVMRTLGADLPATAWEKGLRTGWAEFNRAHPPGVDRYGLHPGGESEYWLRFVERALAATPGAPPDPTLARRALEPLRDAFRDPGAWQVFPDVIPALDELRQLGIRMGVVSNWDSRLPKLLERLQLAPYFDTVVVSSLEGIEKPNPAMFSRAVDRLGATPDQTLHVGDIPELDEAGAMSAGIASVLIDRRNALGRDDAIRDLTGLGRWIGDSR